MRLTAGPVARLRVAAKRRRGVRSVTGCSVTGRSVTDRRHGGDAVPGGDAGFTLAELLVAMAIFTIVMTIVSAALVSAYGSESRVKFLAQGSEQVTNAFQQLDGEVRYAADIETPYASGGNYFVEFQSDWTISTKGKSQCTALEYDNTNGNLQQHTWLLGSSVPSQWQVLASGLAKSVTTNPFTLTATKQAPWQLAVAITAQQGANEKVPPAQSSFSLTAVNTSKGSLSSGVCGGP
ncbi:MAG: prepilin-type N-terminal cleavage/methylation domain-containing protein [Acidobacteriota bacterium]|nr:prepilin-type N-terminal cleavage/methylation domain-containing protein [Acidobacteriota bacterium]